MAALVDHVTARSNDDHLAAVDENVERRGILLISIPDVVRSKDLSTSVEAHVRGNPVRTQPQPGTRHEQTGNQRQHHDDRGADAPSALTASLVARRDLVQVCLDLRQRHQSLAEVAVDRFERLQRSSSISFDGRRDVGRRPRRAA